MALSFKHRRFVEAYLVKWNGTDAYLMAYPGVTRETARINSSKLLTNTNIQNAIDERIKELQIEPNEIILGLANQARGSVADFFNIKTREDLKNIDPSLGKLIKKIKFDPVNNNLITEIELYDSQSAYDKLAKHLKLYQGELGSNDNPIAVKVIYENQR